AAQAAGMLESARAAGIVHFVNFEFRRDPARVRIHELVSAGAIGTPELVQWTFISRASRSPMRPHGWLFEDRMGGGFIGAWGAHVVDAIRWIFGEVTDAWASRFVTVPERSGGRPSAEDTFAAVLTTNRGVSCSVYGTFAATVDLPSRIVISGSEGV